MLREGRERPLSKENRKSQPTHASMHIESHSQHERDLASSRQRNVAESTHEEGSRRGQMSPSNDQRKNKNAHNFAEEMSSRRVIRVKRYAHRKKEREQEAEGHLRITIKA